MIKHSAMVLSSATPSRPIPTLIIPGLKRDVNYMIVTLTIVLGLDLFHSLDYDTEPQTIYRLDGMYLAFNRDMGFNLWDIRFRGDRLVYEVIISFNFLSTFD